MPHLYLSIALLVTSVAVMAIGGIWFLIASFRESVGWGLACIFAPLAPLLFLILHWREASRPFWLTLLGAALFGAAMHFVQ